MKSIQATFQTFHCVFNRIVEHEIGPFAQMTRERVVGIQRERANKLNRHMKCYIYTMTRVALTRMDGTTNAVLPRFSLHVLQTNFRT